MSDSNSNSNSSAAETDSISDQVSLPAATASMSEDSSPERASISVNDDSVPERSTDSSAAAAAERHSSMSENLPADAAENSSPERPASMSEDDSVVAVAIGGENYSPERHSSMSEDDDDDSVHPERSIDSSSQKPVDGFTTSSPSEEKFPDRAVALKIKLVFVTKKKEEDTEKKKTEKEEEEKEKKTEEEEEEKEKKTEAEGITTAIQEKEESERVIYVENLLRQIKGNAQELGIQVELIRVDGVSALKNMELGDILLYAVEDIFYSEMMNLLETKEIPELEGIPIILFSQSPEKWFSLFWKEDDIHDDLCGITIIRDLFNETIIKAMELNHGGEQNVNANAGRGDESSDDHEQNNINANAARGDEGSGDRDGDARSEEASAAAAAAGTDDNEE